MPKHNTIVTVIEHEHQILNNNIIPQSQQYAKILSDFHQKQAKQFQSISTELAHVIYNFKQKIDECETNIHDIEMQWEKMKRTANTEKGYLQAKAEEIKSKIKSMDAVTTGLKETVGKVKPKKIAELPVLKNKCLQTLLTTLYDILYHNTQSSFDWKKFRKLALKHESGEDFIYRMSSINFKQLTKQQYEKLLMLKNDPEFENMCVNTEYAYAIIDIADWIEYVCVGYQFSEEKKASEKEYEKIRKDMAKKSGGSFQLSKKFWNETLNENNEYETTLQELQSEVKSLTIGARSSLQTIKQTEQWICEQVCKVNTVIP